MTEKFKIDRVQVLEFQLAHEAAAARSAEAALAQQRNEAAQRALLDAQKALEALITEGGRYRITGPLNAAEGTVEREPVEAT